MVSDQSFSSIVDGTYRIFQDTIFLEIERRGANYLLTASFGAKHMGTVILIKRTFGWKRLIGVVS